MKRFFSVFAQCVFVVLLFARCMSSQPLVSRDHLGVPDQVVILKEDGKKALIAVLEVGDRE